MKKLRIILLSSITFLAGIGVGIAVEAGDHIITTTSENCSQIIGRCDVTEITWLVREDRWQMIGYREYTRPLPPPPPPDLPPTNQK